MSCNCGLNVTLSESNLCAAIGESAEISVKEAVSYIKVGTAELEVVIQAGTQSFNENSAEKTEEFNTNAETKTSQYNVNATNKLSEYNVNSTNKTNAYNENAENKTELFDNNFNQKLSAFNQNSVTKTNAFNSNAQEKTDEFNANAAEKQESLDVNLDAAEEAARLAIESAYIASNKADAAGVESRSAAASAANALDSETNAAASAASALSSKNSASSSAQSASASAESAATSETNAANSEMAAQNYATAAEVSESNAFDSAELAEAWAIKMDGKVEDEDYSSKYWAMYAETIAEGIGDPANRDLSNLTDTGEARFTDITSKIPNQASSENQLADKNFVNSTVQTATANFRGNWDTYADIPTDPTLYPEDYSGSTTPTVNDYLVIQDDENHDNETWRYKYTGNWATEGKSGWEAEYAINETPFTSDQLAAINSGATAENIAAIADKQDITDNSLTTTAKTIVGAINEVNAKPSMPSLDETTITTNSEDQLQAIGVIEKNTDAVKYDWVGTLAEWEAQHIATSHPEWICYITDDVSGGASVYTKDETYSKSQIDNKLDTIQPAWGKLTGDMNAQTDLKNALDAKVDTASLTQVQVVVETWHEGTEWYRVWSDGWCEQGGSVPYESGVNGVAITFMKPYVALPNLQISAVTTNAGYVNAVINAYALTTTGFVKQYHTAVGNGWSWRACGYIR